MAKMRGALQWKVTAAGTIHCLIFPEVLMQEYFFMIFRINIFANFI